MEIFISKGEKMTFKESITSVYFKNYANFEGKASRSELWWATLFYLIVNVVGAILIGVIMGMSGMISEEEMVNRTAQLTNYYSMFLLIIIITPAAAVNTRRFHDVGKTTKEALTVYAIAFLSLLFLPIAPEGAIIQTSESFSGMMGLIGLIANAYLIYIYVKKPV